MHIKRYILLVITLLVAAACSTEDLSLAERPHEGPVKVGFWVSDSQSETRTQINNDGHSVSWSPQDKVALWAKDANGAYIFQYQKFNLWFRAANSSKAYFATDLASPMTEGQYTYYACYPYPQSVNGTVATFSIPSTQDGKAAGGADIMVAQGSGEELKMLITPKDPADEESKGDYLVKDGVNLNMRHLVHALRFYVPQAHWGFGDEQIERIVFTMPSNNEGGTISGTVTADVSSGDSGLIMTANGSSTISLNLAQTIGKSMADTSTGEVAYDYAFATIMPGTYQGTLNAKVYSQTKASSVAVSFNGREMKAGHITPVGLNCSTVKARPKIEFRINSNNLGEDPYKITLTSEDTSTQWRDGDDHIYEYNTGSETSTIAVGGGFTLYSDDEVLSTISGKRVTVKYETKSAIVSQTIKMPTLSVGGSSSINLDVPWLMYQDFSALQKYTDEATTGAKTLDSVGLPGWTASRSNGSAGSHIRLRPFWVWVLTHLRYQGRLDSEFFGERLKPGANVNIVVTFNAGAEKIATPLQVGKTTTAGAIEAGTELESISATVNLAKGSNSSMPEHSCTVKGVTKDHRLSWRTNITSGSWGEYTDTPIDNIRVKITK